ncbi:MAG: cytochrome d ubiquinol oxidase subunit II, partial [Mucilaginibacter polytrichastri]|nr:cytochrome d ubiquinol oxidase subunit II [Mucilaginibacter polytrichastri]
SVSVGLFTVALCGFLAAIYLSGEADTETDKLRFIRKARYMNAAAFICGALVFIAAEYEHVPLTKWVFANPVGLSAVIAASLSLILLWFFLLRGKTKILRVLSGFQVTMILVAISFAHFPNFILLKGGEKLSLFSRQAPEKTMQALGLALLLGSVLILPFLFYLFWSFQKKSVQNEH